MAYSPEQQNFILTKSGYDPSQYQVSDDGYIEPKEIARQSPIQPAPGNNGLPQPKLTPIAAGPGETYGKELIHAGPAAAAGALGWGVGAALAPETGGLSLLIPLLAGAGTAGLTSWGQNKVEQTAVPEYVKQREANVQANPVAAMAGRLSAIPVGGLNPNLPNVIKAGGTAAKLGAGLLGPNGIPKLAPAELANLGNVGMGTALGGAIPVGEQLTQGKPLSEALTSPETFEGLVGGSLFNKPNAIGRNIIGFHSGNVPPTNERISPEANNINRQAFEAAAARELKRQKAATKIQLPQVEPAPEPIVRIPEKAADVAAKAEAKAQAAQEDLRAAHAEALEHQATSAAENIRAEIAKEQLPPADETLPQDTADERFNQPQNENKSPASAEEINAFAEKIRQLDPNKPITFAKLGGKDGPENLALWFSNIKKRTGQSMQKSFDTWAEGQGGKINERINQPQDTVEKTPTQKEYENKMAAQGFTTKLAPQTLEQTKTAAANRGIEQSTEVGLNDKGEPVRGSTFIPKNLEIKEGMKKIATAIDPSTATLDTPGHENSGHAFLEYLRKSPYKSDRALVARGEQIARDAGIKNVEEHMASEQGFESLLRSPELSGEKPWQSWLKDTKSYLKHAFNKADAADVRRIIDSKWHTDSPFADYFNIKNVQPAIPVANQADETTRVNRENQPAEQTLPEGYRKVNVRRPDGTTYETLFNDKYYEGFGDNPPASIATMTEKGLSHGATRKGEVIEEIPTSTTRLNQPRTPAEHRAQQKVRDEQAKQELADIRAGRPARTQGSIGEVQRQGGRTPITAPEDKQKFTSLTDAQAEDIRYYASRAIGATIGRIHAGTDSTAYIPKATHDEIVSATYADIAKNGYDQDGVLPTIQRVAGQKVRDFLRLGKEQSAASLEQKAEAGQQVATAEPTTDNYARLERLHEAMDRISDYDADEVIPGTKKTAQEVRQELQQTIDELETTRHNQPAPSKEEDFMTSSERVLRDVVKGPQSVGQIINTLKNKIPPAEFDMLERAGIRTAFNREVVKPSDVLSWIKENGPKAEVHTYGMEGKMSKKEEEAATYRHSWYDSLSQKSQSIADSYVNNNTELHRDVAHKNLQSFAKEEGITELKAKELLNKWTELRDVRSQDKGPRATSAYKTVSPFNTDEPMPEWTATKGKENVQRVDVVLPRKQISTEDRISQGDITPSDIDYGDKGTYEKSLWSPDNLHENLPNTVGWSMVQYKTGPKGEKIAVIGEAQSRWGQELRNQRDLIKRKTEGGQANVGRTSDEMTQDVKNQDHPLLRDYNRLILKATIEQARKEGATHIVVPDAETAMMTEGHDLQNSRRGQPLPQEPGMRLNYDTILPKIAEELTGSKGERVSLGEHKNAFTDREDNAGYEMSTAEGGQIKEPRKNLIFRNPDGTPKTDVSGLSFKLPPKRTDPYSLFERHNQPAPKEGEASTVENELPEKLQPAAPARLKDLYTNLVAPEVEKLRVKSPVAADAATKFYAGFRALRGKLEQVTTSDIKEQRPAANVKEWIYQDNPDYQAVVKYRDLKQNGEEPGFKLTPVQEKISAAVDRSNLRTYQERESRPGTERETGQTLYYLGQAIDRKAAYILAEHPNSAEAAQLHKDFVDYRTDEKRGENIQSDEEAEADWKTICSQFKIQEEGNIASTFGAVDKATGKGLPLSMRETNLLDRLSRYNRRYARRLAYEDAIKSDPEAHKAFFDPVTGGVASTKPGRNVLEDIFGIREHNEATRSALSGVVRALMLGPLTGAKDVVSGQILGLQHMDLNQVLPAKMAALQNWKESARKAVETGVVRDNLGGLESGEGGWKNIQKIVERTRDVINVVQGRQLLENISRTLNYGEGRHLTLDAFNSMRRGNLNDTKRTFLDKFVGEDWKKYRSEPVPSAVIDEAAAKFVESVQGGYDYRGLPSIAMKGTVAPYLSLARWNIEKFNNFKTHVYDPATQGNYKPLLMATLGAFVGGTALTKMVEELTGRKDKAPKWKEIEASPEKAGLIAYKAASLASISGYAGILGDVTKSMFDRHYGNRAQTWNNPLIEGLSTGAQDLSFVKEAIQEGDLPKVIDVLDMFLSDYVQAYRLAAGKLSSEKQQQVERSNARRDLNVFNAGQGNPIPSADDTRTNPLLNSDMREFKQTTDLDKALSLVGPLIEQAIKKSNGNPERLREELSKLKRNSYQTMPNPYINPLKFSQYNEFLRNSQGQKATSDRIEDYILQNAKNRAKSSVIPSL